MVTGLLQGLAGGLGAGGGELAARYIAKELFPNKDVSELTEREKTASECIESTGLWSCRRTDYR
ncbi:hypothetical protein PROPEN_01298 [Proteus penneri ATCC 35198]|nr:hypothetical protein PROPEN_01298 [Proteus penneri ATCC 35198]